MHAMYSFPITCTLHLTFLSNWSMPMHEHNNSGSIGMDIKKPARRFVPMAHCMINLPLPGRKKLVFAVVQSQQIKTM